MDLARSEGVMQNDKNRDPPNEMNILQITPNVCSEARMNSADGVVRVISQLSTYLTNETHDTCFCGYFVDDFPQKTVVLPIFKNSIHLSYPIHTSELIQFITTNNIDVIQFNLITSKKTVSIIKTIREAVHQYNVKLVFCLHTMADFPGKEYASTKEILFDLINRKLTKKEIRSWLLPSKGPINKWMVKRILRWKYTMFYDYDDGVVVFSGLYAEIYRKIIKNKSGDKLFVIPNPLSYPLFLPKEEVKNKQKEVIFVGRLSEESKRVSYALKIWQIIEKNPLLQEWDLKIIGDGKDEAFLFWLAKKYHLKRVSFEGRQDPMPYYKRASIMMLTSSYEGWPMVMMEAMPMGCCCISFDSFGAVFDMIDDGYNGRIVPNNNLKKYAIYLSELMLNDEKRIMMGTNAIESSKRFSIEKVGKRWHELYETLTE